jgi:hypothetical protein
MFYRYPKGHPKIFFGGDLRMPKIKDIFGIVFCKVLAPKKLYFPVLPSLVRNKMIYHLCGVCAEQANQASCTHTADERAFTGTWVSCELQLAIEKGYKIIEIYIVHHWEDYYLYNRFTQDGGLFTKYVNHFLKLKMEASGFPKNVTTREQKEQYVHDIFKSEGIQLDINAIEMSECLRTIAKISLNSLWYVIFSILFLNMHFFTNNMY